VGTRGRTVRVVSERHTTTKTASQNRQEIVCGTHEAMRSKARLLLRGTGLPNIQENIEHITHIIGLSQECLRDGEKDAVGYGQDEAPNNVQLIAQPG
jgi:hypothetical protein